MNAGRSSMESTSVSDQGHTKRRECLTHKMLTKTKLGLSSLLVTLRAPSGYFLLLNTD